MKMGDDGFTLVEVIAGFTLLVVLMVSFTKIIKLATSLTDSAVDLRNKTDDFFENYYNGMNYYAENGKPAFRVSKNDANYVNIPIEIKEYSSDSSSENTSPIKTFALSKVHIKVIENLYDKNIARLSVYRYVRDNG